MAVVKPPQSSNPKINLVIEASYFWQGDICKYTELINLYCL